MRIFNNFGTFRNHISAIHSQETNPTNNVSYNDVGTEGNSTALTSSGQDANDSNEENDSTLQELDSCEPISLAMTS